MYKLEKAVITKKNDEDELIAAVDVHELAERSNYYLQEPEEPNTRAGNPVDRWVLKQSHEEEAPHREQRPQRNVTDALFRTRQILPEKDDQVWERYQNDCIKHSKKHAIRYGVFMSQGDRTDAEKEAFQNEWNMANPHPLNPRGMMCA